MKRIWILFFLLFSGLGQIWSQEAKSTFTIQLISEDIQEIKVSQLDFDSGKFREIQILKELSEGKVEQVSFPFLEPSIYLISTNAAAKIRIAVEKSGPIHIQLGQEASLTSEIAHKADFAKSIEQLNARFFGKMIQAYDKAIAENDQKKIEELEIEKEELLVEFIVAMEDLVREMGPSALAYDALGYFDLYKNYNFFVEMSEKFQLRHPNTQMSIALEQTLAKASKMNIGNRAPAFSALDAEANNISLDDYKGSYVLLDFWASWCRACRVENPKFVDLYAKYHSKGFDILSISIDSDSKAWKAAIEQDALNWRQVLDSKHSIYQLYFLSSLPANFLLDPSGKIIARNITAEELKEYVENR